MGQGFGNLTHSAVINPDGTVQWQASPAGAAKSLAQAQSQQVQPSTSDASGKFQSNQGPVSQIAKPSFAQAATMGNSLGLPNAASPGLTKVGKLVTLLTSGLQGALAGRAAQEQMAAASGGRRAGGIGTGFSAGYQLPFTRAQMPLQLQQQQAETGLAQAGLQPVPLPGGITVPAAMAPKFLSPYYGYQGKLGAAQLGLQGQQARAGATEQAAQTSGQYRLAAAQAGLGPLADVPQDLQQQFGLPPQLPLKMLNTAESAANRPLTTVAGANDTYVVNKQTQQKSPLGVGSPRIASQMAGAIEVADPDNPGQTKIVSKGQAINSGAAGAQSASVQTAKKAAAAEVPTKIGDQKLAFNTALQHADLLESAMKALNNGDQQTLNSLKNRLANEFGSTGPVTAQTIAQAYSREVNKMLSGNHITDSEIAAVGGTLNPSRQSPAQVLQVLQAYRALSQSKLNQLNAQKQSAIQQATPKKAAVSGGRVLVEGQDF